MVDIFYPPLEFISDSQPGGGQIKKLQPDKNYPLIIKQSTITANTKFCVGGEVVFLFQRSGIIRGPSLDTSA